MIDENILFDKDNYLFIFNYVFFSWRPIKSDSVTPYILFDKDNSVTPYDFFYDDQ